MCSIPKCENRIAKCAVFLSLEVILTSKEFYTKTCENLTCKSSNVVDGIECALCCLIYVWETKGFLNKCMSGHRFEINKGGQKLLYKHFNSSNHFILSMKVSIKEKIYHHTKGFAKVQNILNVFLKIASKQCEV
jgi:hypothetical protein